MKIKIMFVFLMFCLFSCDATPTPEETPVSGYPPGATETEPGYPAVDGPVRATRTPTPSTKTPRPSATPTVQITPSPSAVNLLSNGTFINGDFSGWTDLNGYWSASLHVPIRCSNSTSWFLQMDTVDPSGFIGWPNPNPEVSDRAWTDFTVPENTEELTISWLEAHHLGKGSVSVTVLGLVSADDFDESWDVLFESVGAHSPSGTGKCSISPPALIVETFEVSEEYELLRLVISGTIRTQMDAYLLGDISITK